MKSLLIGQVACDAGVGVGAVRLYERMGLIPPAPRTESGYRRYPEGTVLRVKVIRTAKSLGFTLKEMAVLFGQIGPDGMSPAERDAILDQKMREVETKIRSLKQVKVLLGRLKTAADLPADRAECVLAEAALSIVQEFERAATP